MTGYEKDRKRRSGRREEKCKNGTAASWLIESVRGHGSGAKACVENKHRGILGAGGKRSCEGGSVC